MLPRSGRVGSDRVGWVESPFPGPRQDPVKFSAPRTRRVSAARRGPRPFFLFSRILSHSPYYLRLCTLQRLPCTSLVHSDPLRLWMWIPAARRPGGICPGGQWTPSTEHAQLKGWILAIMSYFIQVTSTYHSPTMECMTRCNSRIQPQCIPQQWTLGRCNVHSPGMH